MSAERAVENRSRVAIRGPLGHVGLGLPSTSNIEEIFNESGLLKVFKLCFLHCSKEIRVKNHLGPIFQDPIGKGTKLLKCLNGPTKSSLGQRLLVLAIRMTKVGCHSQSRSEWSQVQSFQLVIWHRQREKERFFRGIQGKPG